MIIQFTPEDEAFRRQVRAFLAEKFTPELRAWSARQTGVFADGDLSKLWHRILFEQGWSAPTWPEEFGGPGWTPGQRYIFDFEMGIAGAPVLPAMGLNMCGPVIMHFGTPVQKAYHLPRILSGEHYWCQGYSEPNAGSDLASLRTKAQRDGDEYIVNGTKIWTTHAHHANWMFLLVRTDPGAKPQSGISFLVTPLDAPGISVTPITSMSGDHEVNSVFFDNVRIPVSNRIGQENEGWTIAKYLLEFERGDRSAAGSLYAELHHVRELARQPAQFGRPMIEDDLFAMELAAVESEILAIDSIERIALGQIRLGTPVGNELASTKKLLGSLVRQELTRLAMAASGRAAWVDQHRFSGSPPGGEPYGPESMAPSTPRYLNSRASTIFGGSSEVQKNILAKIALGL